MLALKYIVGHDYTFKTVYMGVANVIANGLIMLRSDPYHRSFDRKRLTIGSSVVLWVSQNMEDDYTYNLAL